MTVKSIFGKAIFLASLSVLTATCHAGSTQFNYENCASKNFGLPLENCDTIEIEPDLSMVMVGDMREASSGSGAPGDYHFLNSPSVPLAVPKKGYAQSDRWEFGGRLFLKIAKGKRFFFGDEPLDVIAVLPKPASAEKAGSREYVYDNAVLSFWYSPPTGVVAIAFPGKGSNGEAYFCSGKKCLFGPGTETR